MEPLTILLLIVAGCIFMAWGPRVLLAVIGALVLLLVIGGIVLEDHDERRRVADTAAQDARRAADTAARADLEARLARAPVTVCELDDSEWARFPRVDCNPNLYGPARPTR
jgi:hypothetical protein